MGETFETDNDYEMFCRGRLADPYPFYHRLRAEEPVHFSQRLGTWVLTRYDNIMAVTRDKLLSSARMDFYLNPISTQLHDRLGPLTETMSRWMSMNDPPDHTRLRGLVTEAFSPRMVDGLAPRIQQICDSLIDAFGDHGQVDLIDHFAYPLPATVICEMLGIPSGDQQQFRAWSEDIVAFSAGSGIMLQHVAEQAQRSQSELVRYFRDLIAQRRRRPKEDLISALIALEKQGNKLTEMETHSMCVQLFVAGHETTTNLIGNGLLALLDHPAVLRRLRAEPTFTRSAVEEFLRYSSPVQRAARVAGEDFQIRGNRIKEGDSVMLMFGAANRDPSQFADPDHLDIGREPNNHLAFGWGPHFCIGAPLARLEARIAFATILRRLPEFHLTGKPLEWRPTMAMRGLKSLPIELEEARP